MMKTRTSRAALTALLTLPVLALIGCAAAAAEAPASMPATELVTVGPVSAAAGFTP